MAETPGWTKWILVRYDAALKTRLDLLEAKTTSDTLDGVDLKTVKKSSIDDCITGAPAEPRRITVKLPKNLAKEGGVLLDILKNYPEIVIADKGNAVSVNGAKLGSIVRLMKQLYAKSAKPTKNTVKILKILQNGQPSREQFKGARNLRVWRKILKFGAQKRH